MHAFLIPSQELLPDLKDILHVYPDKSIGIEEVRNITTFLSKKPIASDKNTVVIHEAHLLTLPAQNALLKTLEEPPANSQIYLVTNFPDQLLPTILSRIQIIDSKKAPLVINTNLAIKFLSTPDKDKFTFIQSQELTREQALTFLDGLELLIHQDLSLNKLYSSITDTRKYLTANCSVKLCLGNLVYLVVHAS